MPNPYSALQVFVTIANQLYTATDLNIISMKVTDDDEGDNEIELTMPDNSYVIADSLLFNVGQLMSMKWGFVGGGTSDERKDYVIMKPSTTYDADGVVSTFTATTKSTTLAAKHPQKVYGATSVKSIISEIANRNSLTLSITGGDERVAGFAHGTWSDRQVIRVLADRFGYQASFSSDTITFAPRDYGATPSIELNFRIGGGSTILTAELSVDAAKSLGDAQTTAVGVDPSSKTVKQGTSQDAPKTLAISAEDGHSWASQSSSVPSAVSSNSSVVVLNPLTSTPLAQTMTENIERVFSSPDVQNLQSTATGENLKKQKKKGELTITSEGFLKARSRMIVHVSGLAKRDSGNWYVVSVVHKIDENGYTCEWELARHGNNSKGGEKNTEPLNNLKPPSNPGDATKTVVAIDAETGKATQ